MYPLFWTLVMLAGVKAVYGLMVGRLQLPFVSLLAVPIVMFGNVKELRCSILCWRYNCLRIQSKESIRRAFVEPHT